MSIRINTRYIWGNLVFWTALCWIIPVLFCFAWIRQNLFGYPTGLDGNGTLILGAFSGFFIVAWFIYFLNMKFEFSVRLTESGIQKLGWGGREMILWEDIRDAVVKPATENRRFLAFYFTDKDGGVITAPVNLFADANEVIDAIEKQLPPSVPRRLRTP